jgi:DNA-binding transcriptional ArsR family regulator
MASCHTPAEVSDARQRIRRVEAFDGFEDLAKVLCEPSRLRIVGALMTAELSVGDLAATIEKKVPATSQHLRVLRELGVIERDRRGKAVVYRLRHRRSTDNIRAVLSMLADSDAAKGSKHDGDARRVGRRRRQGPSGHAGRGAD